MEKINPSFPRGPLEGSRNAMEALLNAYPDKGKYPGK
jgi:hypothetical protein